MTRADMAYVVQLVSQFVSAPCHHHLIAIHRIIHQLRGILSQGLVFSPTSSIHLTAYSDLIGLAVRIQEDLLVAGACF